MNHALWKVGYKQRFEGSSYWGEYTENVVALDNGDAAIKKLRAAALREKSDGRKCKGVRITRLERLASIDIL